MATRRRKRSTGLGTPTTKEFVRMADILCRNGASSALVSDVAAYYATQNPRFDASRFAGALPEEVMAKQPKSCAYTREGRTILHHGKPFLSIDREGDTRPVDADEATRHIVRLLCRKPYRKWRSR